jgi:hypothetical protein
LFLPQNSWVFWNPDDYTKFFHFLSFCLNSPTWFLFHCVPLVHKAKRFDYGFAVMGFFISCAIGHS